ncbi:putative transporter subunit: ATP-binding component of ABC superfamily [Candidatus Zixiibacteriota bacterium]|nr:putative transporter subunit: ATP-binding component of ABC superfamily [candidate division Zixibacteria bacterium]
MDGMSDDYWMKTVDLRRYYRRGHYEVKALDGVSLGLNRGDFAAIVGSSGSGKSTLLNLMAGLDTPTSGSVELEGRRLSSMSRKELAAYRGHKVGMIFQSFNLISHYSALQNVETALYFNGTSPRERRNRASAVLEKLGLADRISHRPADLSGGEQQRVAIARAIVKDPEILFADEPTGNLDIDNTLQITQLLADLNRDGLTIVMVTHNLEMAGEFAHTVMRMHYGKITEEGIRQ